MNNEPVQHDDDDGGLPLSMLIWLDPWFYLGPWLTIVGIVAVGFGLYWAWPYINFQGGEL